MAVPIYRLGTTLQNMQDVLTLGLEIPRADVVDYAAYVDLADGGDAGQGFLRTAWRFDGLSIEQLAILRAYCPGTNAYVYITTLTELGTYETYYARMHWPRRKPPKDDMTIDFVIEFTELVAQ